MDFFRYRPLLSISNDCEPSIEQLITAHCRKVSTDPYFSNVSVHTMVSVYLGFLTPSTYCLTSYDQVMNTGSRLIDEATPRVLLGHHFQDKYPDGDVGALIKEYAATLHQKFLRPYVVVQTNSDGIPIFAQRAKGQIGGEKLLAAIYDTDPCETQSKAAAVRQLSWKGSNGAWSLIPLCPEPDRI